MRQIGQKRLSNRTNLFSRLVFPLLFQILTPEATFDEMRGEPRDRMILGVPIPNFVDRPVGGAVVGGRVVADAVGHGLDEDGAGLAEGDFPGKEEGCNQTYDTAYVFSNQNFQLAVQPKHPRMPFKLEPSSKRSAFFMTV